MFESKVESHLVAGVEAMGGKCPKLVDIGRLGFPDRTVLLPKHPVIFVEMKTTDGTVKSWQQRYHDRLWSLGFRVEVLWTIEQVDEFLESL